MIYCSITVKDCIITGVHESAAPITVGTFAGTDFDGHAIYPVPEDANISTGIPLESYTDDWKLRPLAERVAAGLVTVAPGYTIDGETIREMTLEEKISAGLLPARDSAVFKIARLTSMLAESDYKIIKCYEYQMAGLELPYDIKALHAERQAMRDEINELETIGG